MAPITCDEYFGQWLALNIPHTDPSQLLPEQCTKVPETYKWFTAAVVLGKELWCDEHKVRAKLAEEGNRSDWIEDLLGKLQAERQFVEACIAGHLEWQRLGTAGEEGHASADSEPGGLTESGSHELSQ
jgi:hypothetical protein